MASTESTGGPGALYMSVCVCVCVCVCVGGGSEDMHTLSNDPQFVLRSFCILKLATDTKRYEVNVDHTM